MASARQIKSHDLVCLFLQRLANVAVRKNGSAWYGVGAAAPINDFIGHASGSRAVRHRRREFFFRRGEAAPAGSARGHAQRHVGDYMQLRHCLPTGVGITKKTGSNTYTTVLCIGICRFRWGPTTPVTTCSFATDWRGIMKGTQSKMN